MNKYLELAERILTDKQTDRYGADGKLITDRKLPRIVCAAIRAADGDILIGIRHYSRDMHVQIQSRHDGKKFMNRLDEDQGFVDQFGKFYSRQEAYFIADRNGQILNEKACGRGLTGEKLYSEGLY